MCSPDDPGLPLRRRLFGTCQAWSKQSHRPAGRPGRMEGRSGSVGLAESLAVRRLSPLGSLTGIWDSSQTLFLLGLEMVGADASADLHLGLNFENRSFY